jgi:hypothetical protein
MAMMIDSFVDKSLRRESRAKWFIHLSIEYRHFPAFLKSITQHVNDAGDLPVSQAEAEAREEMTLRPKVETHEGGVEIIASGGHVLALYRQYRDFLKVIRAFRLRWDPDVRGWRGGKERGTVPVAEQIVRLAAALVAEGFTVMVSNDDARSKAKARIHF